MLTNQRSVMFCVNQSEAFIYLSSSPSSQNVVGGVGVVVDGSGVVGIHVGGVQKPEEKVPVSPNN